MDLESTEVIYNFIWSMAILLFVIAIKNILLKVIHSRVKDTMTYHKIRRSTNVFSFIIALVFIISVWFKFGGSLTTYLGIITAGLAVALKDLFINLAAWIFILTRKPFMIGDRIEIANVKGDVIDQRIFQFSLMELGNWVDSEQSTGRIVHMPNSKVFTDHIANYTGGFAYIWNEINVLLTFESHWRDAKIQLREIAEIHSLHLTETVKEKIKVASKSYAIFYKNLTPIIYTDVKESGVQLTLRYLCKPQDRRCSADAIWEDIMSYIEDHPNLDLAYPTVRIYKTE